MRGCKCATSTKAERTSFPKRSSSAVLCLAVRAGQLSTRRKMRTIAATTMSATKVKASGHEIRPEVSERGRLESRWSFTREAKCLSSLPGLDLFFYHHNPALKRWAIFGS
jgi:hypothetical protein